MVAAVCWPRLTQGSWKDVGRWVILQPYYYWKIGPFAAARRPRFWCTSYYWNLILVRWPLKKYHVFDRGAQNIEHGYIYTYNHTHTYTHIYVCMYVVELKQLNAAGSLWCLVSLLTPAWMFSGVAFFIRPYGPRKWRDPESNLSLKVFNIFCATSGMMVPMDSQNLPDQPVTRVCGWVWIMRYHQLSSIRTIIPWTISFVSPENGRFHTTLWLCCLSQSRMFFGWYPIFSRLLATFPRFLCLWPISPIVGECSVVDLNILWLISFYANLFFTLWLLKSSPWYRWP